MSPAGDVRQFTNKMTARAVLVVALLIAGCAPPRQYEGDIPINKTGFAARMQWLCGWGLHGASGEVACLPPRQDGAAHEPEPGIETDASAIGEPERDSGACVGCDGDLSREDDGSATGPAPLPEPVNRCLR